MRDFLTLASSQSVRIGLVMALAHLVVSWWVIIGLARGEPDAQWQLVWIFFLPFDLPFSLLVFFSGSIFPDMMVRSLPYPMSDFRGFLLPAFIHGVLGPIWYFVVPVALSALRRLL